MSIIDALVQKAFSQQQIVFKGRSTSNTTPTAREQSSRKQQQPPQHSLNPQTVVVINEAYGKQTFHDPRNAALFTLLSTGVSLVDFLNWAATERSTMLVSPLNASTDASWKFLLLQDNSLAGFVLAEPPQSSSTASTLPTCSSSNSSNTSSNNTEASFSTDNKSATKDSSSHSIKKDSHSQLPDQKKPISNRTVTKSTKRKTNEVLSASPPPPTSESVLPGTTKKKRLTGGDGGTCVKTRGSARRIPKLEGVTDCPDCKKRGQSIFDPNNWNSDGMVWQYFYCRNQECLKGKSTNRYIGWTVRARDNNK